MLVIMLRLGDRLKPFVILLRNRLMKFSKVEKHKTLWTQPSVNVKVTV